MPDRELLTRTLENRVKTRELAAWFARTAEDICNTFDRAADMHEAVAADVNHPLYVGAATHASDERRFAARERRTAQRYREWASRPRNQSF